MQGGRDVVADIVDLILTDHARIRKLCAELQDGIADGASATPDRLGQVWAELADLLERHAEAEEEICFPALFGRADGGAREAARAADTDISEAVGEARLHPAGSRLWRLAVAAASTAALEHVTYLDSSVLGRFARQSPAHTRQALGRQWLAFVTARAEGDT
jgi:hypothetical protein